MYRSKLLVVFVTVVSVALAASVGKENSFNTFNSGKNTHDAGFYEWMDSKQRCFYTCLNCFDGQVLFIFLSV